MSVRKVLVALPVGALLAVGIWGLQEAWQEEAQQVMRERHTRQIVTPFTVTRNMTTTVTVIMGTDHGFGND